MPIHHRIAPIIGQAISKYGKGILLSDKLALNKAWSGYTHKSKIVSAIRFSTLTGSVVGGLIREGGNPEMDASIPQQISTPSYPKDKTRYRRRGYSGRYSKRSCRPYRRKR